jgi:hypothetical protein
MNCITYNNQYTIFNFLLPNFDVFYTLCNHTDKTHMFIIMCIKVVISLVIYHYMYVSLSYVIDITDAKYSKYINYLSMTFLILLIINALSLIIVIIKTPYDKNIYSESV